MAKFTMNTQVKFIRTGNDELANTSGTIIGTSSVHYDEAFYIVLLDKELSWIPDHKAIVMTEHCLEGI